MGQEMQDVASIAVLVGIVLILGVHFAIRSKIVLPRESARLLYNQFYRPELTGEQLDFQMMKWTYYYLQLLHPINSCRLKS